MIGKGASNRLAVLAEGSHFTLLINDQVVAQMIDDTHKQGRIALMAGAFDEANVQVVFDHLTVWDLNNAATDPAAPPTPLTTNTPTATATPKAKKVSTRIPPNTRGCVLFQNNLNAELTITFTTADGKWNKTFNVARKGQHQECFAPGDYTYTIDAPPPWGSVNGKLTINPGSHLRYPVNGR